MMLSDKCRPGIIGWCGCVSRRKGSEHGCEGVKWSMSRYSILIEDLGIHITARTAHIPR